MRFYFVITAAKKFDIPTLDLKVYDDSKTEIDEEVFEFLVMSQNLGVLEICLAVNPKSDGEFDENSSSHVFCTNLSLPVPNL